jgi:ATP phosphoribosyltransferase regulatory subunit
VGAELYGHAGVESEVEIIGLMLKTFATVGVENIFIDLGNVDIFRNLAKQAGLSSADESQLFEMLQRKAVTEIAALLSQLQIDDKYKTMLASLADLNGGVDVLQRAQQQFAGADESILNALEYLKNTAELIEKRFGNVNLHFDLAELHGYHYKTGVVFAAFVPELGQAIARGGRYDDIGQLFGRARAATGFSTDLKILNRLTTRQFAKVSSVFAPNDDDPALQEKIEALRDEGIRVVQQLSGLSDTAADMGCSQALELKDGSWTLVYLN